MTPTPDPRAAALAPVQSMTGTGSASGETALGKVVLECRSVNGRSLAVKTRLGPECQGLEAALESFVRGKLHRGNVHLSMAVTEAAPGGEPILDLDLAERIAAQLEVLAARLGKSVALSDVLAFPGVVPTETRSGPRFSRAIPDDLQVLLEAAVEQLIASRGREGTATAAVMLAEIDCIASGLAAVDERMPVIVTAYRDRLLARVNELLEGRAKAMEDSDVIREVSLFADRVDIAEEVQRLRSHVDQARELLQGGGLLGRNLEFLVQEMLREVNTMGSKTPDVSVSRIVVEMKSSIDKLKEQAANLE